MPNSTTMGDRVLVCGGRAFEDRATVYATLDAIHASPGIEVLIEGGARGADRMALQWAQRNRVPVHTVKAQWETHGIAAGPIRNIAMLELKPTLVVAFPGGKGTADMVRRARTANVEVREVVPPEPVNVRG